MILPEKVQNLFQMAENKDAASSVAEQSLRHFDKLPEKVQN